MEKPKKEKSFLKKWWFWLIAAVVIISVAGNSGDKETDKTVKEPSKDQTEQTVAEPKKEEPVKKEEPKKEAPKKDGISKAEFEQIQNGMTYEDVVTLVGSDGELQSESEVAGYKTVMYTFKGESGIGANASLMFQNNELTSKSQFGLK